MSEEKRVVKGKKPIVIGIKILLAVFLVISSIFLLRIIMSENCGQERFSDFRGDTTTEAYTITGGGVMVLQENPYRPDSHIRAYSFCTAMNASNSVNISIVDFENRILASDVVNGFSSECYALRNFRTTTSMLGVKCHNCNATHNLTLYEVSLGSLAKRAVMNSGGVNVSTDYTLDYTLIGFQSCWHGLKVWGTWFLTGAIILLILWGLFVGEEKTKDVLYKDW